MYARQGGQDVLAEFRVVVDADDVDLIRNPEVREVAGVERLVRDTVRVGEDGARLRQPCEKVGEARQLVIFGPFVPVVRLVGRDRIASLADAGGESCLACGGVVSLRL